MGTEVHIFQAKKKKNQKKSKRFIRKLKGGGGRGLPIQLCNPVGDSVVDSYCRDVYVCVRNMIGKKQWKYLHSFT